jgi:formylglycine-generating enzyme required for sulfatase activity
MSRWSRIIGWYLFFVALIVFVQQGASQEKREALPINDRKAPGPAPEGMVWIPGGWFWMGCEDESMADAQPVHKVYVDGFWMDKTEVTNEEYARFVKETKYLTEAEKKPDAKDFPGVPADKLKPFSLVFKKPDPKDVVDLTDHTKWWDIGYGASWQHPEGPASNLKGREKHPVVHICWHDAVAFCKWAKKRLPTEAEWEFAARGGLNQKKYCWGDELKPKGKWQANIWQGKFPHENTKEDGFEGTAPVASFPANGYGLHDMTGNAWEWCADWYHPDYYKDSPEKNPQGPKSSHDPLEPNAPKRVQRGGSFLCADNYCVRYIAGARGKGEITSAANHIGFRCVRNP